MPMPLHRFLHGPGTSRQKLMEIRSAIMEDRPVQVISGPVVLVAPSGLGFEDWQHGLAVDISKDCLCLCIDLGECCLYGARLQPMETFSCRTRRVLLAWRQAAAYGNFSCQSYCLAT